MSGTPEEEAIAARRFAVIQVTRILSLGFVIAGIAIAQGVLPAPYWLGVAFAVGGMVAFFFTPPLLAKGWKAGDRGE